MRLKLAAVGMLVVIATAVIAWQYTHHSAGKFASVGDPIPTGEYRSWTFTDSDFASNEHRKRITFRWTGRISLDYLLGHDARWECRERGAEVLCESPHMNRLCTADEMRDAKKAKDDAQARYNADRVKDPYTNPFDDKYWPNVLTDCWAPHDWQQTQK